MPTAAIVLVCAAYLFAGTDNEQKAQPAPPQSPAQSEIDKAVEEFKAVTRELGLREDSPHKQGQSSGAKAAWHGRLFENFRNDFLDAVPHEVKQRGDSQSTLRRNQFGFNVAGPVIIPRVYDGRSATYFSLSYEGVRENVARSSLYTVPTLAERTGDFASTVDEAGNPCQSYDPASTRPNPSFDPTQPVSTSNLHYERDPFPNNEIPVSRLDPVALKALAYYPGPNANAGPFFQNDFFVHAPEQNIADGMIGKLDHTFLERHRVSLGLSYSNGLQAPAEIFANGANPGAPHRNFDNRSGSLSYVFTASPRTINTFTFEASSSGSQSGVGVQTDYPAVIGLQGSPGTSFPYLGFSNYLSMGNPTPVSDNVRNSFVWSDSFSTRRGKHSFVVTSQFTRTQVNTFSPASPSGSLYFDPGLTSLPGIIDTGDEFASFLLGMAGYAGMGVVGSPSYFRSNESSVSLRHTYEASRELTFNLGLNFHTSWPRTEKYDRQSTVDLAEYNPANGMPGALVFAGQDGYGSRFQPVRTKLEPNASIAWNPGGGTSAVVRASFWRSYSGLPLYFGQWGTQGFNATPSFISPDSQLVPSLTLSGGLPPLAQPLPYLSPTAANNTYGDIVGLDPTANRCIRPLSSLLERELPGSVIVTAGVSYAGAKNQYVGQNSANPNAIPLADLQYGDQLNVEQFNQSLKPYPQFTGFDLSGLYPWGDCSRDAASLRVEKRASQGLTVDASYEFSKSLDDYSGPYGNQSFNPANDWALTPWNSPHHLSIAYNYELPIGAIRLSGIQ